MPSKSTGTANIHNVLGKPPGHKQLEDCFDLGKVLGKGAFGTVRYAVDKKTGDKLACKSISKAKLVCKEDIEDVQREVAIMNHVAGHQHIVNIRDSFEDKHYVHIVMEVCEGGELFDSIVESGNFTEKKAAQIFRKMVDMLAHCHDLGVMHRDLKPENFLLTSTDKVKADIKATDFGLSMFFKPGERFKELVGSPYYVAPEVLKKNYSYEADIWSLGVILYILLSGLPPFWGDNEEQIFRMVLKGNIDFATDPWPKISDAAKDLIKKLMVMDPTKRPKTEEILKHPWLAKEGVALDKPMDSIVVDRIKKFAAMNKLKKTALMVIGHCLSLEEIEGMRQLFNNIDTDKSGTITIDELRDAMHNWGHKIPQLDLEAVMAAADVDGDGTIDYNEFVAATMNMGRLDKEELLQKAFLEFDTDRSGTITVTELEAALKKFNIVDNPADLVK